MNNFGFLYSLSDSQGGNILTQSVSGTRIGTILEHIAKTVFEHQQKQGDVQVQVWKVRIDEKTEITDRKRLGSINTLVTLATEHYNQKAGKLVVENIDNDNVRMAKNLKTVLSDPKKAKKLVSELELPSLEIGDTLLVGKFKNRKAEIKGFDTDDNGQPIAKTTKGDQKIFKPRIAKLMPVKEGKYPAQYPEHRGKSEPVKAGSPFTNPPKGCTCHTMKPKGASSISHFCSVCQSELRRRGLLPKS